jgi:hypothetical protein
LWFIFDLVCDLVEGELFGVVHSDQIEQVIVGDLVD